MCQGGTLVIGTEWNMYCNPSQSAWPMSSEEVPGQGQFEEGVKGSSKKGSFTVHICRRPLTKELTTSLPRVTRFYAHFATAQTIKAHFYSFSTSCRAHFSRFSMQKLSAEASTPDLFPLGFLKHCLGGCAGVLLAKSSKCLGVKSSF